MVGFDLSQVALIVLAMTPLRYWASFRTATPAASAPSPGLPGPSAVTG